MSDENLRIIETILREADARRKAENRAIQKTIEANAEVTNLKLDAIKKEVHEIHEIDEHQEEEIDKLKNETSVWRWAQRNPKISAVVFFISVLGVFIAAKKEIALNILKKIVGL
jgi:hypothetical protein